MFELNKIYIKLLILIFLLFINYELFAGPPFNTDDPEPVELNHWELYLSSVNMIFHNYSTGTLPHIEINYGAFKNTQLHLILPLNYSYNYNYNLKQNFKYSYSFSEFGIKYRFIEESENMPQIGIFPLVEFPESFNYKEFQILLPIWFQKSFKKLSTYGGFGYWINPGKDNLNWFIAGWQVQYEFSDFLTQGIEVFYHTKQTNDDLSQLSINYGGFLNLNENIHLLFSLGHSVTGNSCYLAYLGLMVTL